MQKIKTKLKSRKAVGEVDDLVQCTIIDKSSLSKEEIKKKVIFADNAKFKTLHVDIWATMTKVCMTSTKSTSQYMALQEVCL